MKTKLSVSLVLAYVLVSLALGQGISNFTHVIIVVQENRTPDNLFQGLCSPPFGTAQSCSTTPTSTQYNIQISNWLDKTSSTKVTQPLTVPLASSYTTSYDLSHWYSAFRAQCDKVNGHCLMDGAAGVACTGACPTQPQFRYVSDSRINPYLTLATRYGWANYMFQTNQGPSFPAHQFIFGGTSAPTEADDTQGIFALNDIIYSGSNAAAGCIAPETTTVQLIIGSTLNTLVYPCFEHQTMADLVSGIGTWRYYTPSAGTIWNAPNAIAHICQSTGYNGECRGWNGSVVIGSAQILTDISGCHLANLSWVVPTGQNSDHPRGNTGGGPDWVASIVNAVGTNAVCPDGETYWNDTAIVITWDDWGGWYDHEPPTILTGAGGNYQYGFRVPFIFVSAYTGPSLISNSRYDFGSILRFVEHNWGFSEGALNFADARAMNDLSAFYNLTSQPRAFVPVSTKATIKSFIEDKSPATDPDDD